MGRLSPEVYRELDARLAPVDAALGRRDPGDPGGRQPVHTVYVPADRFGAGTVAQWGAAAREALDAHPPLPYPEALRVRVDRKLATEPVEDLRIDFEDGYGVRGDDDEDGHAKAAAAVLAAGPATSSAATPFVGLRIKSLEAPTRARGVRTLEVFLDALGAPPPGFVVTLPKVSHPAQVEAMAVLCGALESAGGLPAGNLRFEVQIEVPAAVPVVAALIAASRGRCAGLHYGTYDYSAALGIAAAHQSLEHPAADHAKAVMQVAAAGTGVPLSDGSTNVLPVGSTEQVHAAWALHLRLVRRSLERGFYQGWDLHPAQLPTRFAATYGFFRDGFPAARDRLRAYLDRRAGGILDEPATARALAGYLRRGLDCGALDPDEVDVPLDVP